jgi:hypothetical protein
MFLPKDPLAARDVIRSTTKDKLHHWLRLLTIVAEDDDAALEVTCMLDDVVTVTDVQTDARRSIDMIERFLEIEARAHVLDA